MVTSFFELYFPSLLSFTETLPDYFVPLQVILVSKEQGLSLVGPPVTANYPEALEQPWVTVSDKSSAADIPRQWPAIGLSNSVCVGAS